MSAERWQPLTLLTSEGADRLIHDIKFGVPCDDDADPIATPELDALDDLADAISTVRAQLKHPIDALQFRKLDNLPATPEQRAAARTAVWNLRVAVARTLFALAPENGTDS